MEHLLDCLLWIKYYLKKFNPYYKPKFKKGDLIWVSEFVYEIIEVNKETYTVYSEELGREDYYIDYTDTLFKLFNKGE